jgi:hypothetical protein
VPETAEKPDGGGLDLETIAVELYAVRPDEFVPERDEAVAKAREAGQRDLARAIGKLRRPTRAAWLANLLARERPDQLEGLLGLAAGLADAQRTLDGSALRALSSQRHRLVAAVAAEAGRLAAARHEPVGDGLLRDVQGILEAALADPEIADEVRSGRLTRTVSYSGFGPAAEPGAVPAPPRRETPPAPEPAAPAAAPDADQAAAREREERERRERERARREEALAEAEAAEAAALDRQHADDAARDDAVAARETAKGRVAELTAELEAARNRERDATAAAREAEVTAKASAREAGRAAAATARARARLDELSP